MTLSRRTFLGFLAAPAIIRVAEIMPIKPVGAARVVAIHCGGWEGDVVYVNDGGVFRLDGSYAGKLIVFETGTLETNIDFSHLMNGGSHGSRCPHTPLALT